MELMMIKVEERKVELFLSCHNIEKLLADCQADEVDPLITTDHFPSSLSVYRRNLVLYIATANLPVTAWDMMNYFKDQKESRKAAKLGELCAYLSTSWNLIGELPLISLDSCYQEINRYYVPAARKNGGRKILEVQRNGQTWPSGTSFLSVPL